MEIVLIRHGQPEWVKDGEYTVDPGLTELESSKLKSHLQCS